MKTIGKNTLRITSFIAGLLVLLLISSVILQPKTNGKTDGMNDASAYGVLGEKENSIDVLILGDSEAYSSFVPLKLWKDHGITSYVCATPSQKISYSLEFLKKTLKTQKPKVVVMETNALFRKVTVANGIQQLAEEKITVFRYHNRWKSLSLKDLSFGVDYTDTQLNKGYIFASGITPSANTDYMSKNAAPASIASGVNFYVNEMKRLCDENGAKLLFISTPSTINWNRNRHDAAQKFADEKGIDFIDLNLKTDEVPINWATDTKDGGDHLNFTGAVKVTSFFGSYLSDTGLFTDKRGNTDFSHWNSDADSFTKGTGAAL